MGHFWAELVTFGRNGYFNPEEGPAARRLRPVRRAARLDDLGSSRRRTDETDEASRKERTEEEAVRRTKERNRHIHRVQYSRHRYTPAGSTQAVATY